MAQRASTFYRRRPHRAGKVARGVTQTFGQRQQNAVVVPAHVAPADLANWLRGVSLAKKCRWHHRHGPHKFACCDLCGGTSDRARFLKTVNTMRRNADGSWHGDIFDGLGFVAAMRDNGCEPLGKRALLVGAGGAGSAIAHALVMAGVSGLAIHDEDAARRTSLVDRLAYAGPCTGDAWQPRSGRIRHRAQR